MAEKEVRKTIAQKTVRRSTSKVSARKTPVRKTEASAVRKAPSRVTVSNSRTHRGKKVAIILTVLVAIIGVSIGIGYSDKGQIDVSSVIASRKQNASPDEQNTLRSVPVQQSQTGVVNGGLVGSGKPVLVPSQSQDSPDAGASTESASSTEETSEETTAQQQSDATEGPIDTEGSPADDPVQQ